MKRLPSVFVGTTLVLSFFVSAVQARFPDVPFEHEYARGIQYVKNQGIVKGYPDGNFGLEDSITRAAFVKIIVLAVNKVDPVVDAQDCFPDVKVADWYHPYVCWAVQQGIIQGYPDGSFQPANTINFAEASKILVGAMKYSTAAAGEVWYQPFVETLEQKRAIPIELTSFTAELTRGQMAEMIYRLLAEVDTRTTQTYASLTEGGGSPSMVLLNPVRPGNHRVSMDIELMDMILEYPKSYPNGLQVEFVQSKRDGSFISNFPRGSGIRAPGPGEFLVFFMDVAYDPGEFVPELAFDDYQGVVQYGQNSYYSGVSEVNGINALRFFPTGESFFADGVEFQFSIDFFLDELSADQRSDADLLVEQMLTHLKLTPVVDL